MTAPSVSFLPCVVVATGWREPAERAARAAGLDPRIVIGKEECTGSLREVRRRARREGIQTLAIHSGDWDRQAMPQLFELAAARLGLKDRRILNDSGAQRALTSAELAVRVATLPVQAAAGATTAALEGARLARRRSPAKTPTPPESTPTVLTIWRGLATDTPPGGPVTHASGIFTGFRRLGLRVVLLTTATPPHQLAEAIDELEIIPPLPPRLRLTKEIEAICTNRLERARARRLAARLRPRFVYMRYEAFMTSGVDVALSTGLPIVLEWNSSQVWTRANWQAQHRLKQLFNPVLRAAEAYDAARSSVVAAVSEHAAAMAIDAGAPPDRVIIVPNGVDLEAIDRARAPARAGGGPLVGWVGSFGYWHGTEVLVRALSMLPADVGAVMVGDGVRRPETQALARKLGVYERIEWTGSLPHREAVARLSACDVLASPQVPLDGQPFFGSPTKMFEYMAIGRPIVASALEQMGEVLEDGRTARLVTPGDPTDLAAGIAHVLALPDRGASLGAAARREAESTHSWDDRARAILDRLDALGVRGRETMAA